MKLMAYVLSLVLLAPCFSPGCTEEHLTQDVARARGEEIFADYLKGLRDHQGSRLERTDYGEAVVTLQDDFGASIAFRRLDRPAQESVSVLIGLNGCISISGTP
jgi:hypothetical protein